MSTATVVRLAQALGFNGYNELQQNARHGYLRTLQPLEILKTRSANGRNIFEAELYQDMENLRCTLHALHFDQLAEVARRIERASRSSSLAIGQLFGDRADAWAKTAALDGKGVACEQSRRFRDLSLDKYYRGPFGLTSLVPS